MLKSFRRKNTRKVCLAVFIALQLFNLFSFVWFLVSYLTGNATPTQVFNCLFSVAFVCLPSVIERIFHFRAPTFLYIFCLLYAVCPMLGHSYGFYYTISFWDKLLHLTGGVVFALFGAYLPKSFLRDNQANYMLCALFGLLFSISVACVWEFVEFSIDELFLADMQKDTIIRQIHSYKLSELLGGNAGEIFGVESVGTLINGKYYIDGYLDIGRTDTMYDLLVETAGAVCFFVAYLIDKGKRLSLRYLSKKPSAPLEKNELCEVAIGEDNENAP